MLPLTIFEETFVKWLARTGDIIGFNVLDSHFKATAATISSSVLFIVWSTFCLTSPNRKIHGLHYISELNSSLQVIKINKDMVSKSRMIDFNDFYFCFFVLVFCSITYPA